jgi:hypothetical protein
MKKGVDTPKARATIGEKNRRRRIKAASHLRSGRELDRAEENRMSVMRNSRSAEERPGMWKRFINWLKSKIWQS